MKESICTIPITEVFSEKSGCPICKIKDMLEKRAVEYTIGASKMQPDTRIKTNNLGFCNNHFTKLIECNERSALAVILESRAAMLAQLDKKELILKSQSNQNSCFVCEIIDNHMDILIRELLHLYETEEEFRALFAEQEVLCYNHFALLTNPNNKKQVKKHFSELVKTAYFITNKNLETLHSDLAYFCSMFDYNNNKSDDWKGTKDIIERTFNFFNNNIL